MAKEAIKRSLYVATHAYTSLTKVGISNDPTTRMNSIKTYVGADMTLEYESPRLDNPLEIERLVHTHFAEKRIRGEWINETPEKIIEYIKTIEDKFDSPEYNCLYCDFEIKPTPEIERVNILIDKVPFKKHFRVTEKKGVYICPNYKSNLFIFQGGIVNHLEVRDYRVACSIASKNRDRIVEIDLETGDFIKNPKFRIKNE